MQQKSLHPFDEHLIGSQSRHLNKQNYEVDVFSKATSRQSKKEWAKQYSSAALEEIEKANSSNEILWNVGSDKAPVRDKLPSSLVFRPKKDE